MNASSYQATPEINLHTLVQTFGNKLLVPVSPTIQSQPTVLRIEIQNFEPLLPKAPTKLYTDIARYATNNTNTSFTND